MHYAKVHKFTPKPGQRVIVISDIHGNLPFFQGLLRQIDFSPEDALILLGDMLEKGENSLELLEYILELEQSHTVLPLCGNCDAYVARFFETDHLDPVFFQRFLEKNPQSTLRQMGERIEPYQGDLPRLRQILKEHFSHIHRWIRNLPILIDTPDYLFVHGGIHSMRNIYKLNGKMCMKNDNFYRKKHSFPKYLVVGHTPTTLYHRHHQDASPICDKKRKIISIDGGCVLKLDGQLNALILEGSEISWEHYDGLPKVRALAGQNPSPQPLNVRWGHAEVEVLPPKPGLGAEFSWCRHLETQQELAILTCFLRQERGKTICQDATDYLLPVEAGELLSVSHRVAGGVLGKKNGVTGWYFGEYEEV